MILSAHIGFDASAAADLANQCHPTVNQTGRKLKIHFFQWKEQYFIGEGSSKSKFEHINHKININYNKRKFQGTCLMCPELNTSLLSCVIQCVSLSVTQFRINPISSMHIMHCDKNDFKMESDSGISVNLSHFDGGTARRGGGGGEAVTVAQVINGGWRHITSSFRTTIVWPDNDILWYKLHRIWKW